MAKHEVKTFLSYTDEHAWVRKTSEGTYRIGITDYAQQQLGSILYADLPEEDDELTQGESYGSVESSKTVSDLFAPISGKVVAINDEVIDEPETINASCYDNGWLVEVEASDYETDKEKLLDAEGYKAFVETL